MSTLKISSKKQEMIKQLPAEIKQALLDHQRETLLQDVYETATGKLITVWAVDLCSLDEAYIFANEVRQLLRDEVQP